MCFKTILDRVSAGMCYKTILDVDDGFGAFTQHVESTHILEQTQDPECMHQFQEELKLDQSSKFTSCNLLAAMDLKFRFDLRLIQNEHPGL